MLTMMQLHVSLVDSHPLVWRRLIVEPRLTLAQLHTVLQIAFGWMDAHLHQFHEKDGTRYSLPTSLGDDQVLAAPTVDERTVLLRDVFTREGNTIAYEYDFGDSWIHAVTFEQMVDPDALEYPLDAFVTKARGTTSGKLRAASCIAGERSGPPEDCGGIDSFQEIVLASVGDWDPGFFDLGEVNRELARVRVKKSFLGA